MMTHTTKLGLLVLGAVLACAPTVSAQGPAPADTGFLNVDVGFQAGSRNFDERASFQLYDEPATFEAGHDIGSGGLFDISAGVRLKKILKATPWDNLSIGIGFSRFTDNENVAISASIPHPLFFDQPRSATAQANDVGHSERVVYFQAIWTTPVTEAVDVSFSIGPSFFSVKQDLVSAINVTETGPPFTTVNVGSVTIEDQTEGAVGFNIGVDGTYLVTRNLGGGVFLRYTHGSVNLPLSGGGEVSLGVGGFQIGGGLRVRF